MDNSYKQQSLEEKLITTAPFSTSFGQNYINHKVENSNMRKSTSWLKKGLIGLGLIATLGFSGHKAEAQVHCDNSNAGKWLSKNGAEMALMGKTPSKKTADYNEPASIDYSKYEIPEAISSSNDTAFKKYWISQEEKMSSSEISTNLNNISNDVKNNNPYYFLAIIKNGGEISKSQKYEIGLTNPGLREHIVGTEFYYQKDWKQARLHYAMGMFKSAQIDKSDLDYLNIDNSLNQIQIYKTIADKFIEANYEKKEEIIQKVILNDNNRSDKLKMVYDNFGGFLMSEGEASGYSSKTINKYFKTPNNSYRKLGKTTGFNSGSTGLYFKK